ncbi:hypothetical protein ZIOFF_042882 [Zingiber officinale]|uniref:Uncharacterized protein n=1 Tax=Zingiber officinale TaxID=94328 RepID=A0A8J5FWD1_ZINOF|nr:hypothetical protein ZIOFF_042882 [Zingiber officinale]
MHRAGGLLVILSGTPNLKLLGSLQGFAAGLMLCVSFFDLTHNTMNALGFLKGSIWFYLGALFFASIVNFIPESTLVLENHKSWENSDGSVKGMLRKHHTQVLFSGIVTAIVASITVHNFPEGMTIFVGSMKGIQIGVNLALAIALHNIPESGVHLTRTHFHYFYDKVLQLLFLSTMLLKDYIFLRSLNPEILEGLLDQPLFLGHQFAKGDEVLAIREALSTINVI